MIEAGPRLLFVPVSGAFGMGEYARSLAIAHGVHKRWPSAAIRFILSRAAPYAATVPYPTLQLDSSPTFHAQEVIEEIRSFRPDAVLFDNAGRTAQLQAARACGAVVIYLSARRRQRRKAFRFKWMRLIDEHWIAYPRFIAGALGPVERLKLAMMHRPQLRYLDVIMAEPCDSTTTVPAGRFVLVVPGGGTGHPGARAAVEDFWATACALGGAGIDTVFIGGTKFGSVAGGTPPRAMHSVPQAQLAALMRAASLIIVNGGSTLLQAMACGRPCLAVPIAGDQAERIRRCVAAGAARAAPLDRAAMCSAAFELLADEPALERLGARAAALGLADGVTVAVQALADLLAVKSSAAAILSR